MGIICDRRVYGHYGNRHTEPLPVTVTEGAWQCTHAPLTLPGKQFHRLRRLPLSPRCKDARFPDIMGMAVHHCNGTHNTNHCKT